MKSLILVGGGGHCESVIDVIEQQGKFEIVAIIDKKPTAKLILGYPVHGEDQLETLIKKHKFAHITVGQIKSAETRVRIYQELKELGAELPILVSPRAYVAQDVEIGEGTVVMHDALINRNSRVGVNCIINSKSLIEHGCEIGNHCHISTSSTLNGEVQVHDECFIGSGSVTHQSLSIGRASVIAAGSLLRSSLESNSFFKGGAK